MNEMRIGRIIFIRFLRFFVARLGIRLWVGLWGWVVGLIRCDWGYEKIEDWDGVICWLSTFLFIYFSCTRLRIWWDWTTGIV